MHCNADSSLCARNVPPSGIINLYSVMNFKAGMLRAHEYAALPAPAFPAEGGVANNAHARRRESSMLSAIASFFEQAATMRAKLVRDLHKVFAVHAFPYFLVNGLHGSPQAFVLEQLFRSLQS